MRNFIALLFAISLAASASAQQMYNKIIFVEPMPIWQVGGTQFEVLEQAVAAKDAEVRGYSNTYVGNYWICEVWDAPGCGGMWAYNKKFYPVMFDLYDKNSGAQSGRVAIHTGILCPNGAYQVYYQSNSMPRRWDACQITIQTPVNPGPQNTTVTNPFVTGIDWSAGEGCTLRPVTINRQVVERCFKNLQVN